MIKPTLTLAAGLAILAAACSSNQETPMANGKATADSWVGAYSYRKVIEGADDGQWDYNLEIKKAGDEYKVKYTESQMRYFTYFGTGKPNKAGGLDVFFTKLDSNLSPTKMFKPGNHMFTLSVAKKTVRPGVKLDWEMVPGDDLKKSSVTMLRPEPDQE